jgi:hypothetical protein
MLIPNPHKPGRLPHNKKVMKFTFSFILIFLAITASAQSPKTIMKKLGNDPVFFVDSINVDKSELSKYQPTDIATVSVYKDSNAIRLAGPAAKDGAVYIETKVFAKKRYWQYFKSKSPEYANIIPAPGADSLIQYILNKRILKENFEGTLSLIDDKTFKQITIIDRATLEKNYKTAGKSFGVIIISDVPEDLYKGKKKF